MNEPSPTPQSLFEILAEELRLLRECRALLEEERHSLAALSVERIYEGTKRKETLALQIRLLEEARKTLCQKLSREYGLRAESSLVQLCRKFPQAERRKLLDLRRQLREQGALISRCHEDNRFLVDSSYHWIQLAINVLRSLGADQRSQRTYNPTGEMSGTYRGRILDRRQI